MGYTHLAVICLLTIVHVIYLLVHVIVVPWYYQRCNAISVVIVVLISTWPMS